MADKTFPATGADSMDEALHRLSRKPGVKGWIMLDRSTGAVIKTNGQISAIRPARPPPSANGSNSNNNNNNNNNNSSNSNSNGNTSSTLPTPTATSFSTDVAANVDAEAQAAQELGAMVYGFMSTAGSLVQEMDTEDELKLLRLRTKKQELVIVPELKYILVVVHDTPPA